MFCDVCRRYIANKDVIWNEDPYLCSDECVEKYDGAWPDDSHL